MGKTKYTLCAAIANRTNYTKLRGILLGLKEHENIVDLRIVASSTVLLDKYGACINDIEEDELSIDRKIDCILMNDSHETMAKTVGLSMIEHASYYQDIDPDMLLVVGDRFDILPSVLAAAMMNVPIVHVQGGESSGTIDNTVRKIISQCASLHFPATESSRQQLIESGIDGEIVFNYGCPAVEYVSSLDVGTSFDAKKVLHKKFKRTIDIAEGEPYLLVMIHPDTRIHNDVDVDVVLRVILETGLKAFVFYPNADANNSEITGSIGKFRNHENLYLIKHMPISDFVATMAHASCMIGNSSAGIREAASFGVPVINLGLRQSNRERNANTRDVACEHRQLKDAIQEAIATSYPRSNIYYKPNCTANICSKIVETLTSDNVPQGSYRSIRATAGF